MLIVAVFSRPIVAKMHLGFIISQGVIIPAVLLSAAMWGLIEYLTPPGKNIWSVIDRIVPSFLIGAFLGGALGYLFHFAPWSSGLHIPGMFMQYSSLDLFLLRL